MFDFSLPLGRTVNLIGGADFCQQASSAAWGGDYRSLETRQGLLQWSRLQSHRSGVRPFAITFKKDDIAVMAFVGVQDRGDCNALFLGQLNPLVLSGNLGWINSFVASARAESMILYHALDPSTITRWLLVGHSFGGCVASAFARLIRANHSRAQIQLLTLGSPKFASGQWLDGLVNIDHVRLMNHGDFIPYLFPRPFESPTLAYIAGYLASYRWASCWHSPNGLLIRDHFDAVLQDEPSGFSYPIETNGFLIADAFLQARPPHWLTSYQTVLSQLLISTNPFDVGIVDLPRVLPRMDPPAVVRREVERIVNTLPPALDPLLWTGTGVAPTPSRMKVRRQDRQWFVLLDDVRVYRALHKRDAYAVARMLRSFTKELQENYLGFLDLGSLPSQLYG